MEKRTGEREEQKGLNLNLEVKTAETNQKDIKSQEAYNVSSYACGGSTTAKLTKSGSGGDGRSGRFNCLCSPTTHAGSFRCRYHRLHGALPRGSSVPSNLSMMDAKSDGSANSLKAQ